MLFGCPRPTLGHCQGDSLTNRMLITAYVHIRPEGHWEPRKEVGSLSPAERLVDFVPGTFRFLFQYLNPLGHSPQMTLYTRKICITATSSNPFSVDYCILHFIGKTLETVNVLPKCQSFNPCTKVEMYFVEIWCRF